MAKFSIEVNNPSLGGLSPLYYRETYPSYGNKNQAGAMLNCDCLDPGYITMGPALVDLTNGTQAAAITTLIKGFLDNPMDAANGYTYAVGGAKLYQLTNSTVTNSGGVFPHTIDRPAVTGESGEDVCYYDNSYFYSYRYGTTGGDIGIWDGEVTFDDDWGSTVPSGAGALINAPLQMIVGGNDVMYFTNGSDGTIGSYDKTTYDRSALALQTDKTIAQSIAWCNDRLYIATMEPNNLTSGAGKNKSSILIWDGVSESWETEISFGGSIGALLVKNGTVFVWYRDGTDPNGSKLGYVNGNGITDLCTYDGDLPTYYQVSEYKDYLIWINGTTNTGVYAYGSGHRELPAKIFQLSDGGYTTIGGLSSPFGYPMVASTQSTSYRLARYITGTYYDVNSNWKSLMFDITGTGRISQINSIRINFEKLASNARVDWKLLNNKGETIYSDIISNSKLGAVTSAYYPFNGKVQENFRVEFDWTNGNISAPVKIKNFKINCESNG